MYMKFVSIGMVGCICIIAYYMNVRFGHVLEYNQSYLLDVYDILTYDIVFNVTNVHLTHTRIWSGIYEGTVDGCYCYTSDSESGVYLGMHRAQCSYNETHWGCIDIAEIKPRMVYKLKRSETINTQEDNMKEEQEPEGILVYKYPNSSFSALSSNIEESGDCKEGFMKCGGRSSDKDDRGICVPQAWGKCPITHLKMRSIDDPAVQKEDHSRFVKFPGFYIEQWTEENRRPIVHTTFVESHVCKNPLIESLSKGRTRYELNRKQEGVCEEDPRYIKLDEQGEGERDLFDLHGVEYENLIEFYTSNEFKWFRMYRRQIHVAHSCRFISKDLKSMIQSVSQHSYLSYYLNWGCFLFLVVSNIYRLIQTKGHPQLMNKDSQWYIYFSTFTILFVYSLVYVGTFYLKYVASKVPTCEDEVKPFVDNTVAVYDSLATNTMIHIAIMMTVFLVDYVMFSVHYLYFARKVRSDDGRYVREGVKMKDEIKVYMMFIANVAG